MTKTLPRDLTSYDLLKSLALILMIIDHVGHFFFPDEMWFRVLGRLCVPIWFFLIGYARITHVPKTWWIAAVLVAVSAVVSGQFILPLNILFTLIFVRILRDRFVLAAFGSMESLRGLFFLLCFLTLPTAILFEYGAMGMMFALFGYAMRHPEFVSRHVERKYVKLYTVSVFFSYYMWQGVVMPHVSDVQALFFGGGLILVGMLLWRFNGAAYSDADRLMARSFIRMFQFMGRRTLLIYTVHLILFRLICMYLYPDAYVFMGFQMLPLGALNAFL